MSSWQGLCHAIWWCIHYMVVFYELSAFAPYDPGHLQPYIEQGLNPWNTHSRMPIGWVNI